MDYQLRPATEEDREWAYRLKRDAYIEVVERQFGPWDETWQRALFRDRWNPSISQIVRVAGEDVGIITTEVQQDALVLDEIQLANGWRGRGLGSKLIGALLDRARAHGKSVKLQVLKENVRAKALYHRLGFDVVDESETHFVMRAG